jgi:hypothetical protein
MQQDFPKQAESTPDTALPPTQATMSVVRITKNKERRDEVAARFWEWAMQQEIVETFPEQVRELVGNAACEAVIVTPEVANATFEAMQACRGWSLQNEEYLVEMKYAFDSRVQYLSADHSCVLVFTDELVKQTRVLLTDARVVMIGHSSNKAACIAISTAVQTFARIMAAQALLAEPVQMKPEEPRYDVLLVDAVEVRRAIAGLHAALVAIARECPGMLLVADNRKREAIDTEAREKISRVSEKAAEDETIGSFADLMPDPKKVLFRSVDGRPLIAKG